MPTDSQSTRRRIARSWTTRVVVAATVVATLALATSALAAIDGQTSSDPGGAGSGWTVTLGTPGWSGTLTALYPGAPDDTERLPFTVADGGQGNQQLSSITASVLTAPDGDAETAAGADIQGCLASWFTVSVDPGDAPLPATISPGGSYTETVGLAMRDSGTDQDACQGTAPGINVTAS